MQKLKRILYTIFALFMKKQKQPIQKESKLHLLITNYLRVRYPDVIFRTDFGAGMKMTIGQAMKHKRMQSSDAYPDIFIAEPKNNYCGFFIELKRVPSAVHKKDGNLRQVEHIQKQYAMLIRLRNKGYKAEFGLGYQHTIHMIDEYLASS
jgi:hypothetical protein